MSIQLPEPPAAANKWLGLLDAVVIKQLIPILLLIFMVWWDARREDKNNAQHDRVVAMMREDLIASRKEVSDLLNKVLDMAKTQASEVKAAVKDVSKEVRATGDVVKVAAGLPVAPSDAGTPPPPPPASPPPR